MHVLIPDAKYHGERSYEIGFKNPFSENLKDFNIESSVNTLTVKDVRIMMDYFESSNPEKKLNSI
jgi:hypothetical protein